MIKRYSTQDMAEIWSDQNKYQKWLDVEIAVCEAWAMEGVVPKKSLNIIKSIKFLFLVKRHGAPIKQYTYLKKFALFCVFSKQSLIVFL